MNVFGTMSLLFYLISLPLRLTGMDSALLDGFVILGCLPMTINMSYVLTLSSKGNSESSLFNATFGNILGIFLTPVLILLYLDKKGEVEYQDVLIKMTIKVIIPLIIGQITLKIA